MALPLSISMLRRKRDQIRDAIAAYESRLREAQADLAHVLATLRVFEASGAPADWR
jgi:predicted component of type VI protein secretion system